MPKVGNAQASKRRRKKVLKSARGYFGNKSRLYRYAKDAVIRAGKYAFRDRRKKKNEFRQLWIVRLNAACRENGITYSRFMAGIKNAGIELDRKSLSELAINDPIAFKTIVEKAKNAPAPKKADKKSEKPAVHMPSPSAVKKTTVKKTTQKATV